MYWATGTTINTANPANSGAITTGDNDGQTLVTLMSATAEGSYSWHVPANQLGTPPKGTTNLLVVIDPPTTMLTSTPTPAPAPSTDGYGEFIEATDQTNVAALSVSASVVLSNSVHAYVNSNDGTIIQGTFMPAEGPNPPPFNMPAQGALTLAQAEAILGVDHFNWLQQVTYTPPTLQPVTLVDYNYESTLLKLTGNQLEYVLPAQEGNYTLDSSNPLTQLTPLSSPGSSGWAGRSAPFVDPIVPKAGFEYTQQYLRGFIIDGEYAYIWPMNGTVSTTNPPPPDGFFYYYNEPYNSDTPPGLQALTSQYDTLTPNTTEYSLQFSDRPELVFCPFCTHSHQPIRLPRW